MIKRVVDSYKNHIIALTLGPAIKLLEAIFDLLIPLFMKAIIDLNQYNSPEDIPNVFSKTLANFIRLFGTLVPTNQSLSDALVGGTIILIMGVVGFGVTMSAQYIAARTATEVGYEIRQALFNKIIHLSKKDREKFGNSRLLTTLSSDTYQIQQGVFFFTRLMIRAPFIILGSLVFSFILDYKIGLAFIILVPTLFIMMFTILRHSSKQYLPIQSALDDISTRSSDDISGARVVRAFNRQNEENDKFEEITKTYESKSIKVHRFNSLLNPLIFALTALITILIVYLCRGVLLNGTDAEKVVISSTLIAEMAYLAQIFFATCQLPPVLLDIVKAGVSRKRVDDILKLEPAIVDGEGVDEEDKEAPIIEFNNVSFSYSDDAEHQALNNLSFKLKSGQTLGIIGGTGSGKSTIINLIERFYDPSSGTINLYGHDLKDYALEDLRNNISLVNQKSSLFKGTIRSNFSMANFMASDEEMIEALKKAEAYEFVSQYDDFLDHEVIEGGKNFSGGQRQRLCIARALVENANILILDDSTSALDLLTDKKIRTHLASLENVTKIIVSQRVSTIADADIIILLDKGSVMGIGTHEQLLKDSPIYLEIFESQARKG